jgi:hypothetical protein
MTDAISSNIELIIYLLKNKLNNNLFECSICYKNTNFFYTICKPECMSYSYCKKCVEHIIYERKKCPFTNIELKENDMCLDYRLNNKIEERKLKQKEIEKIINNRVIKNISIKIDIT